MPKRSTFLSASAVAALATASSRAASAAPAGGASLIVLYNTPTDVTAFDSYYFGTHAPLAKKLPGLRSYTVSKGGVNAPGSTAPPDYHLFAELRFDSVDAIRAALGSAQGKIVVGDLPNFAQAGTVIRIFETTEL